MQEEIMSTKVFTTAISKQNIKSEMMSKLCEHIEKIVDDLLKDVDVKTTVKEHVSGQSYIVISELKMPGKD